MAGRQFKLWILKFIHVFMIDNNVPDFNEQVIDIKPVSRHRLLFPKLVHESISLLNFESLLRIGLNLLTNGQFLMLKQQPEF